MAKQVSARYDLACLQRILALVMRQRVEQWKLKDAVVMMPYLPKHAADTLRDRAFCKVAFLAKHRLRPTRKPGDLHVSRPQFFSTFICFFHFENGSHGVNDPLTWHFVGPVTDHKDGEHAYNRASHCHHANTSQFATMPCVQE